MKLIVLTIVCVGSMQMTRSIDRTLLTTSASSARLAVRAQQASSAFNVKDFGAKGDGRADDRVPIQATIDHVHSIGGGTVFLPKGTYLLQSVQEEKGIRFYLLNIFSDISLIGEGEKATIIVSGPSMPDETRIISADSTADNKKPVHDVLFENFTLDGSAARQNHARSMVGISMVHTHAITHQHLTIKNIKGTREREGANFDSFYSNGNSYIDCTALTTTEDSNMTGSGFSATASNDILYERCHSYNSGWWMGFTALKSHNIIYRQCDAALNHQRGFNSETSTDITYDRCTAAPIQNLDGIAVNGNVANRGDGFYAFQSQHIRYDNCLSSRNEGSALFNHGSSDLTVIQGRFEQNGAAVGFDSEGDCSALSLSGTQFVGNSKTVGVLHPTGSGDRDPRCNPGIMANPSHPSQSGNRL